MSGWTADEIATSVAIIGLAVRLPGAPDVESFWRNLLDGADAVSFFDRAELLAAGWRPDDIDAPGFVPARAALLDAGEFDAEFFGMSPAEAARTDPQHRIFLECCVSALEDGALDPARFSGSVGLYGACAENSYLTRCLLPALGAEATDGLAATVANDKDHLVTRVSYKLGLTGPSVLVQASCASALVAVHQAAQALLTWQCDAALAGGASVTAPVVGGRRHRAGDISSPDGRTRSFDAEAAGTVSGDGVGVVLLRRLADALADGDPIRAVLRGSAINNDGARKLGYSAPSLGGQAECVTAALAAAGVEAGQISFVEAHGTATPMGDPVEIAALAAAFGSGLPAGSCAVGSVKSNLGHLGAAAAMPGLVKAVLALERGLLPPTRHFRVINPAIELAGTPFFIADRAIRLDRRPLLAGLSSFGAGGTNAHAVLEAPPPRLPSPAGRAQVLALSARSEDALSAGTTKLAACLAAQPDLSLDDVGATLIHGRRLDSHRLTVAVRDRADAIVALGDRSRWRRGQGQRPRPILFFCPAHGAQRVGMGRALYTADPVFRASLDRSLVLFSDLLGEDLDATLTPRPGDEEAAALRLADQRRAGPALFSLSLALAASWEARGVRPDGVLGHSVGELAAAVIAGAMTMEEGVALFAARTLAIDRQPRGAGLHVGLSAEVLENTDLLGCFIALRNGPRATVITGLPDAVAALEEQLRGRDLPVRRVAVSFPAHSPLLEGAADAVRAAAPLSPRAPGVPFYSGVVGGALNTALDQDYWVRHLLEPVNLMGAVAAAESAQDPVFLELGPRGCGAVLRLSAAPNRAVIPSLGPMEETDPSIAAHRLLDGVGALWAAGVALDDATLRPGAGGRRISLPGTVFQRRRHWIDPPTASSPAPAPAPPSDLPLETRLSAICAELIGIEKVGLDDHFLALGGDSLFTLRLVDEVELQLGLSLPPSAAWTALSLRQLLALLPETAARPPSPAATLPSCLVPLRATGVRPPIFIAHPLAGVVFPFVPLSRALGEDQPVYGLQAAGVDGTDEPDPTVEAMATRYLAAIRQLQPHGPYYLAGYSFGALIAYELARLLAAAGEPVGLLALMDEVAPVEGARPGLRAAADLALGPAGRSFLRHLRDYLALNKDKSQSGGLSGLVERTALAALLAPDAGALVLDRPAMKPLLKLARVHWRENFRYAPPPWSGKALLFRSQHWTEHARLDRSHRAGALGWEKLVLGGVDIHQIDGDHLGMIREPHVLSLAREIRRAMDLAMTPAARDQGD